MTSTTTPAETRTKIWNDREYAEAWEWRDEIVLRWRSQSSYPWRYCIGEFTKRFEPFADRRDRPMTQDEIRAFKRSRSVRATS